MVDRYIFDDEPSAQAFVDEIMPYLVAIAQTNGIPTQGNTILGQNALTGETVNIVTDRWCDPEEMEDGTFGVLSLRDRFPDDYEAIEDALMAPIIEDKPIKPPEDSE